MAEDQNVHSICRSLLGLTASQQPMETNALIREVARRLAVAGASLDPITGALSGMSDATTLDGLDSLAFARLGSANAGHLIFVDNSYDIGASGATRPRDCFLSRNAVLGGTLTLSHGAGDFQVWTNSTLGESMTQSWSGDTMTFDQPSASARAIAFTNSGAGVMNLSTDGTFTCTGKATLSASTNDVGTITTGVWNAGAVTSSGAFTSSTSCALTGTTNNVGTITTGVWNAGAVTSSGTLTLSHGAGNFQVWTNSTLGESMTQSWSGDTMTFDQPSASTRAIAFTNSGTGVMNLSIDGALSKGSGTFLIDHPLDRLAQTTDLYHGFVEAPRYDLIYRGSANVIGETIVSIDDAAHMTPGTFVALTQDPQVWAQHERGVAVRAWIAGGAVHLATSEPGRVSWLVIAERRDVYITMTALVDQAGRLVPEQPKTVRGLRHPKGRNVAHAA